MEVFSQNIDKMFRVGIQVGLNASLFDNKIGKFGANQHSDYENYVRISPAIGITGNWRFTDVVSLQPEILYSLRGGSYRRENGSVFHLGGNGDEKAYYYKNYRLNYLEVPILIRFNLAKLFNPDASGHKLKVHFSSGLAPAINVVSGLRYNEFTTSPSSTPIADVDDSYKVVAFDYANRVITNAVIDVALDFGRSNERSTYVNLRYSKSISDVYNVRERLGYNMETTLTTITLGFGHSF